MRVTRTGSAAFRIEFESDEEVRAEESNLTVGGLRLPTKETLALNTLLLVTVRGPGGGETTLKASVVAPLPDGVALAVALVPGFDATKLIALLLERVPGEVEPGPEPEVDRAPEPDTEPEKRESLWDRMRNLSQTEKILLAVKADRSERAALLQDNDPRVLLSLLRNPRITVDEVVRIAKSSYLNQQIADVIVKTGQWMASVDLRLALVYNAKTPQPFALRILPTLPEPEVRNIARGGTSMALKTAAVKQLQAKKP